MRKIFWITIIVSFLFLSSCSEDDGTTSSTASALVAASTAAGSITVGTETLSGVYASSCYTSNISALVSAGSLSSDTQSYGFLLVVTGNDNVTEEFHGFTDTTCSTKAFHLNSKYDNVSVGSASGSNYQIDLYTGGNNFIVNTSTAETWLETLFSGTIDLTQGTALDTAGSGSLRYGLWNLSGTTLQKADVSSSAYPSSVDDIDMNQQ